MRLGLFWAGLLSFAAVIGQLGTILLFWVLPLLWCRYAFLYWSEIADHYNTRQGTRSRPNAVVNWFQHNKGYHAAHHRFPAVPWFNLPAAQSELEGEDPEDVAPTPWATWCQLSRQML